MTAAPDLPATDLDHAAEVFAEVRPRLFGIAYRMLGSAADAEDVVQETWLRWQAYDRGSVREAGAFLATTTTRLAINATRSARARHESYVGPWLPEPVDTSADPALGAERGEALEMAVLMLLERLSPTERAAYVLREAFDYPYDRIADVLETRESNARQLVSRARKHVTAERPRPVDAREQRRLLTGFLDAARNGDLDALEDLLAADAVSYSDGGGVVRASRFPVVGRDRVARFVAAFAPTFWLGTEIAEVEVNGLPAALVTRDGAAVTLLSLAASDQGIDRLLWVMNPAKLASLQPSGEDARGRSSPDLSQQAPLSGPSC
jgi:RNA polymerase sigma-70 factor (TIGR02957 family)